MNFKLKLLFCSLSLMPVVTDRYSHLILWMIDTILKKKKHNTKQGTIMKYGTINSNIHFTAPWFDYTSYKMKRGGHTRDLLKCKYSLHIKSCFFFQSGSACNRSLKLKCDDHLWVNTNRGVLACTGAVWCSGPGSSPGPAPWSSCCAVKLPGSSVLHVQPCVEGNVLGQKACCGRGRKDPPPGLSLAVRGEWQARGPLVSSPSDSEGLACVLIIIQVVWTHAAVPVMWPTAKLLKSDWSRQETLTRRQFARFEVPFQSGFFLRSQSIVSRILGSSNMSTANQILGDRSDVPDLLRSLADYPFSFPAFEDTGRPVWLLFKPKETLDVCFALIICWNVLLAKLVLGEDVRTHCEHHAGFILNI